MIPIKKLDRSQNCKTLLYSIYLLYECSKRFVQPVLQPAVKCRHSCSRLYNRLYSRLYNRLYSRLYNRLYNRLQSVNGLLSRTLTSLNNNSDFHLLGQYSPSNRTLLFFHRCDQNHRQYSLRFAVTHLSTNRARRGVTLLMHNAVTEARPPAPVVTCSTDV